jgi:CDP-diacylglycerol--glycerol-3-phosphate 3-phosphatidyltransferase
MNTHQPPLDNALTSLRRQWCLISVLYSLSLGLGYTLLYAVWQPGAAQRWTLLAGCVLSIELWFLWRWLPDNYRPQEQRLLPRLGAGNMLTILRGLLIGLLAGFLFSAWPPGWLAYLPGGLYTLAAVGDSLDGYVSRKTDYTTQLGKRLDMEADALGMLVATVLAVQYHQLPVWYLCLGFAHYFFGLGQWWRTQQGKPVYGLPLHASRRVIGGCQVGFVSAVLWPVFSPPMTTLVGILFGIPTLLSFTRDWLVVSGHLGPVPSDSR